MDTEPQLNLTPYTVAMAIATVVAILASPQASSVVPPSIQGWFSLANIVIPALIAVLFVRTGLRGGARNVYFGFRRPKNDTTTRELKK